MFFYYSKIMKYLTDCQKSTTLVLIVLGTFITISITSFGQAKQTVQVTNIKFNLDELTISAGDALKWINPDGFHNVNGNQENYTNNTESYGINTIFGWTLVHIFTVAGMYDYHCNPHVGVGMTGIIEVKENDEKQNHQLTINFSGMNTHVGQTLWISFSDKISGEELAKKNKYINQGFSKTLSWIETGHFYNIDFFADHNSNVSYDAPPTDHARRLQLNNVSGDTTLNFQHNTNFTDVFNRPNVYDKNFSILKIYLNPTRDKITIESDEIETSSLNISIYDFSGSAKFVSNNFLWVKKHLI